VVSPALVCDLGALLTTDGEVHVATDIFEIALDAMAALESARFQNLDGPWTFRRRRSRRERQCEDEAVRIWRLAYRRAD
jgi:tRNA (guanine-N7-)-methyltransferase